MSQHTVIVFEEGWIAFVAGHHESLDAAKARVASMVSETYGTPPRFVYDDNDDIVIVGDDHAAVSVWNRHEQRPFAHYAAFDFSAYLAEEARLRSRRLLGFRIINSDGMSIHGTGEDPFELSSDAILTGAAVLAAKAWAEDRDYLVVEAYGDDAEAYVIVEEIAEKTAAARI